MGKNRHLGRAAIEAFVALACFVLLANLFAAYGWLRPVIVHGRSMAPSLVGPHKTWHCSGCGSETRCDFEALPEAGRAAICSACGGMLPASAAHDVPGERVWIDRSTYLWRHPARFETIALRDPDDPSELCVKRVIGLPGETIELVDGDVVVDGRVLHKDAAARRALEVPVPHRSDRWQGDASARWQSVPNGFQLSAGDALAWLDYHHREPFLPATGNRALFDSSPVDQAESRALNLVRDFSLRFDASVPGLGSLHLHATSGADEFHLNVDLPGGAGRLLHDGRLASAWPETREKLPQVATWELAIVDYRVELLVDNQPLVQFDYQPARPLGQAPFKLAIGGQGPGLTVQHLQLARDVYYTAGPAPTRYQLGPDEYFVLGDNSPHSIDSRHWARQGGVTAGMILGRVVRW